VNEMTGREALAFLQQLEAAAFPGLTGGKVV
jgi:hypothetical protein